MSRRGLYERVVFDSPRPGGDGQGGLIAGWKEDVFTCRAAYTRLLRTEAVMASRLVGVQPTVIRVRASSNTNAVTTDWRVRDKRSGEVFNIRSIVRSDNRRYYDMTAESGVAT